MQCKFLLHRVLQNTKPSGEGLQMKLAEGDWRMVKMAGQVMEVWMMELVKVVWGWQKMVVVQMDGGKVDGRTGEGGRTDGRAGDGGRDDGVGEGGVGMAGGGVRAVQMEGRRRTERRTTARSSRGREGG